jgi:transketolase
VIEIDGNDYKEVEKTLTCFKSKKPTCIIAKTVKGKGVSFMETPSWHAKAPNKKEYDLALKELK